MQKQLLVQLAVAFGAIGAGSKEGFLGFLGCLVGIKVPAGGQYSPDDIADGVESRQSSGMGDILVECC